MPGDKPALWVIAGLREGVPEGGLGAEIHIAEQELTYEIGWYGAWLGFFVGIYDGKSAMIEKSDRERAKVQMRGEECG